MLRVFSDLHHSGLFYSLKLLFEDRLGGELYRPIGEEWFGKGFWDVAKPYNDDPGTIKQYLSLDSRFTPIDGTPVLNKVIDTKPTHYVIEEKEHNYQQKAITFEQFKAMDIDIIIASIPSHWITYKKLRNEYKPKAKVIAHMGNMFNEIFSFIQDGIVDNLMASTIEFPHKDLNTVFYHQEQPLVDFIPPDPNNRKIKSFVHLLPKSEQFNEYKTVLNDFEFKAYGAGSPNGWVNGLSNLYSEMQDTQYVYHVKPGGDGYGWNWHSAFMLGRPVLTNFTDYEKCLGGKLFEDGITGFNLEAHTVVENCDLIRRALVDNPGKMAEAANKRFKEIVNYDLEEQTIRKFLEMLK